MLLVACAIAPPAPAQDAETGGTRPFTGYLKIRQKDGTLAYEINVIRGRVTSGVESHEGREPATADIVGGWYDRERLMLLIQSRDPDIRKPWSAHAHQFRRDGGGFMLVHTLYGFGETIDSGEVYRPHVIEVVSEAVNAEGGPEGLEGTWVATEAEQNGDPAAAVVGHRLTFRGDRFQIRSRGGELLYGGRFLVDDEAKPAAIDFEHSEGALKGTTWRGIYALDGETLTSCDNAPHPDGDRPSKFEAGAGSGAVLIRFERAKP